MSITRINYKFWLTSLTLSYIFYFFTFTFTPLFKISGTSSWIFSSSPRSLVLLPPVKAPFHSEFLCFMVCSTHQTILCGLVFHTTFPMYDVFLPLPINSPGWSISNIDFVSHTMLIEVQTFKTELDRSWELNLSSQQLRRGGHAVRVVWWISHLADEHSEK